MRGSSSEPLGEPFSEPPPLSRQRLSSPLPPPTPPITERSGSILILSPSSLLSKCENKNIPRPSMGPRKPLRTSKALCGRPVRNTEGVVSVFPSVTIHDSHCQCIDPLQHCQLGAHPTRV